jgi:excisionase family DNA binding protein
MEVCMTDCAQRLLTISQAAARLGVHPDTLRAWADKGLVPVVRTPTGYRRFQPAEIERVREEMGLLEKIVA